MLGAKHRRNGVSIDKEALSRKIAEKVDALRALRAGRSSLGGTEITSTSLRGEAALAKEIADLKSELARASSDARSIHGMSEN